MIEDWLTGETLTLHRREHDWCFQGRETSLCVAALWRLRNGSQILLTSKSDGHQFGLVGTIDAEERFNFLLRDAAVSRVQADEVSADLCLSFSNAFALEVISDSFYESWQAYRGDDVVVGIPR